MCGIAGAINYYPLDLEALKKSLYHRGPDEQSIYTYKNVALIHTRLAIQDILNAHQPFHFKNYSIIFNGEIYNHFELRELYLKDIEFKTTSDTETLLMLFIRFKEQALELLDGMFAFCVFDKSKNSLFLARDRAGKKPLYYIKQKNLFLFASEINSIKKVMKLEICEKNIASYLRVGYFYRQNTAYKELFELEGGNFLEIDCDSLEFKKNRYFDIKKYYLLKSQALNLDEAKTKLKELLFKSIKDRLLSSDLEVGAFLSSGIDSSLIVAIASQIKSNLKTFTVSFKGIYNEAPLARLVAKKYETNHIEVEIELDDLKSNIEKILLLYGEPFFDSSAIPSYYVSREAKRDLTVILNGDGADELFGGYRRYVPFASSIYKIARLFSSLSKLLPKPNEKKSIYNYIYRLLELSNKKSPLELYLSATTDIWEGYSDELIISDETVSEFIDSIFKLEIPILSKMMLLDFELILFGDLLIKMDIATMANSLEARSPFLSKYTLEFAPSLPNNYKIDGTTTKSILRNLAKEYLPSELINQPKRGFEVPLKEWVENELKELIYDLLIPKDAYARSFVKSSFLDSLLENRANISREKRAKMLWSLFALEVWKRSH